LLKTILLLKENTEPTEPISSGLWRLPLREADATPGCTCDRWGHPCADCVESKPQARNTRRKFSLVKK